MSSIMSPNELIVLLNDIVHNFDHLTEKYYIDKIKTIGDAYFCVAGAHASRASDHTERMVKFAIDIFGFLHNFNKDKGKKINLRIGIHTGECVGGVIGHKKFAYDLVSVIFHVVVVDSFKCYSSHELVGRYHQHSFKNGKYWCSRKNSTFEDIL